MPSLRQRPLSVLFFTIFLDLLGFGIVIPILPIYADELGASGWMIGLITGIFAFMQFLFAPFWGNLSDRIGRRPVLLTSIAIMSGSYLLFAGAVSIPLLLFSRILGGIGAANISAANAFISDMSTDANRAKNFGIVGAAFGLGFIFGPPLGGWLKDQYGIEWVGYTAAILGAANFLMAMVFLPESLREKDPQSPLFPNPFRELRNILPRVELRGFLLSNFIFLAAFSMMHVTSSLLWQDRFGLNEKEIGYVFAFIGISVATVQGTLIGSFNRWIGERRLYLLGSLLMGVGLLAMPYVPVALFVPLELAALLIIAVGNGFFTPTVSSLVAQRAASHERGKLMGLLQSVGSLSRVIGPLIGGTLYDLGPAKPYLMAAAMMFFTAGLAWQIVKRRLGGF